MKILVPLDGSEIAEVAVGHAAQLARGSPEPTTLVLARMIELTPMAAAAIEPYYQQILREAVIAADDYLRAVSYRPSVQGITCHRHVDSGMGQVAARIIEVARSESCDLIVMSSRGRSGIALVVLGSVAADVARHATIPTLIFRPTAPEAQDAMPTQPFTALVPLDGSPLSEQVLPAATLVARALHGRLRLLRVLPTSSDDARVDHDRVATAEQYLPPLCERAQAEGVPAECSFAFGEPALEITHRAENGLCDLIALATHGRTGVERFFLGSVAGWLMDHTPTPLLIVRPQP